MEKNKLFYKLLNYPLIYSLSQKIMSATSFRKNIIKNIIKKKNPYILDIGCGPGEILETLSDVNYFGFDVNKNHINFAREKYRNKGIFKCSKFSSKKINKKIKFDYVLLLGLLHHLNDKQSYFLLSEIKKVLKKNGMLITLDNIYIKNQNIIAKKLIDLDKGENVRTKKQYLKILDKDFKKIQCKIYVQKFIPYTWFVSKSYL